MLILQENAPFFGVEGGETVPLQPGTDGNSPDDWDMYYDICYQVAARYGRNTNPGNISIRAGNQPRAGLDYIRRIETRNESHVWWDGSNRTVVLPDGTTEIRKDTDWTPEEEASMTLACSNGAKNADPQMSVSLPGVPGWDRRLLARSKAHAERINNGQKVADDFVTNVYWNGKHADLDYRYTDGLDFGTGGVHPEDPSLKIQLQDFMTQITSEVKAEFPDSTFMIGEFGYDTIVGSGQSVDGTPNTSPEKQQGQWLVRALLQMFAGKVDKAYLFMINGDSPGLFASSGLTRDDYSTKLGWYHVVSALEILNDAVYMNDLETGTDAVKGHKLTDDAGNTYYALWSPTADDSETDFVLELGSNHGVVTQKDLNEGIPGGYTAPPIETVRGNSGTQQITVRVTETPTFIVVAPN